jgi:hypothetical protein
MRGTMQRVDTHAAGLRSVSIGKPWILAERDAWLVIEPFAISGRRLLAAEREWAFRVDACI